MKVLIVDDNAINRKVLRVTLRSGGHEVAEATDGLEALETLGLGGFDAVITDILMPRLDGYRLCYRIRQSEKLRGLLLVVYSSTYTSPADEQSALSFGADRFIRKPASASVIFSALEELARGPRRQPAAAPDSELEVLREYSERLVEKLEDKNLELQAAREHLAAANEEIRRSEEQVRLLLDSTAEGIYGLDFNGRFTFCNASCVTLLGYTRPEELLGKHAHTLIHHTLADGRPFPKEECGIYRTLREDQGNHSDEDVLWRADGTSFPAEFWSYPVRRDGKLAGAVVTFLDIAERKRDQKALQQSEERFRRSFSMSPVGMVLSEAKSGRIIDVNNRFARIMGYERDEVLGRTAPEIGLWVNSSDRERLVSDVSAIVPIREREVRLRSKTGAVLHVLGSIEPLQLGDEQILLSVFQDITERKRAEEALRQSEQRFSRAFNQSPVATSISEAVSGRIVNVNEQFLRMLGYEREQIIGRTSNELGIWADPVERERLAAVLTDAESTSREVRLRTRSGEIRDVVGSVVRVDLGSIPCALSTFLDITDRKHSEIALRESESRQRAVFEAAPDALIMMDHEGKVVEFNPAAVQILGFSRDEVLGKPLADLVIPPELRDRHRRGLARYLATGEAAILGRRLELPALRKDGEVISAELTITRSNVEDPPIFTGFLRDITDRKRVEEALRRSEERYRQLFERNLAGVFRSTLDGRLLECNDAFARVYGYASSEEILTRPATELYSEPKQRDQLMEQIRKDGALVNYEERGRRRDGSLVWMLGNYTLVPDASGAATVVEGTLIDITERKQLEEQYRQAQKMEAIGQLAGGVAHDFNNLLTVILGYSDLLATEVGAKSPLMESIGEIRKSGERAASLTRQLLAFSRQQVLEPKVLEVNALVLNLEKMLHRLIGEDMNLVTVLDPAVGRVYADAGQIEQVILNLAVNSRDAMPRGGKLTIETSNVDLDEAYAREHVSVRPGRYVMLAVADTGVGMSTETKSHMFEPFFTTKGQGKGTGLGLATVYGIVKQSGGYIWVYSEPDRGTTFKVYLPRVDAIAEEKGVPAAKLSTRGAETILLVEDDQAVRALTRRLLEEKGYKVLEASSAQDAIAIVTSADHPINLLLTDVVMPEMGGSDLASRLVTLRPGIKVLYMSGYTDDAVVRHGLVAEGARFLQKPFTPDVLARKLREVLDS